jgi:glycopeptide antibiotics resistance protein
MREKPVTAGRLLSAFYIAALIQITVLRGGVDWGGLFQAGRSPVQWAPFKTTLEELQRGAWPFVYHVAGNLLWFVPLGWILRRKPVWVALIAGMLLSTAIECLQWGLRTGMTDVDDVILNTCGAGFGRLLAGLITKPKRPNDPARG